MRRAWRTCLRRRRCWAASRRRRRDRAGAEHPALRAGDVHSTGSGARRRQYRQAARCSCGRTPSTTTSTRVAKAAVEVLEDAGYQVMIPGRGLAAAGRSTTSGCSISAKRLLKRDARRTLGRQIQAGVPIVGLEPSCVAVFRDEMANLFPTTRTPSACTSRPSSLSEFLDRRTTGLSDPAARPQGRRPRPLPSQGGDGDRRPSRRVYGTIGPRLRSPRFGLLRHGGQLWVRGGALCGIDGVRRTGAAARRCARPRRLR